MSETTEVFEIHDGATARGHGVDTWVCKSIQEAIDTLYMDLDSMEENDEIKIVFKRYTQAEMVEIIYD